MVRDRLKKSSVSIIAILLILILIVLPTGYEDAAIYKGTDRVRAKVISTDESSVINNGLIQSGEQYCKVKILDGKFKNETADAVNMLSGSLEADKIFQKGDVAHVVISYSKDKILSIMMSDHYRLAFNRVCRKNRFKSSIFVSHYNFGNLENFDTSLFKRCESNMVGNCVDCLSYSSYYIFGVRI